MNYEYEPSELSPKQQRELLCKQIANYKTELEADGFELNSIEVKPRAKIAKSFGLKSGTRTFLPMKI